jgi:hypothetical protein
MKKFIVIVAGAFLSGCITDIVTSNYATLADARADELFNRGWLPDVLPPSAVDIRTTNNLDINVSNGEFSFSPADSKILFKQLHSGGPNVVPNQYYADQIEAHVQRGYSIWSLQADQTTWIFFCQASKGHCTYTMWLDQQHHVT